MCTGCVLSCFKHAFVQVGLKKLTLIYVVPKIVGFYLNCFFNLKISEKIVVKRLTAVLDAQNILQKLVYSKNIPLKQHSPKTPVSFDVGGTLCLGATGS